MAPLKRAIVTSLALVCASTNAFPTATTLNGTYTGLHNATTNLDYFLGIPYAQPPINALRFRNPVPLNTSWTGTHTAQALGNSCIGYGSDMAGLTLSEDCLNLNIVRPAGSFSEPLPVAVWFYGGGYYEGSANRPAYNQTRFVANSVEMGLPVIGVGFNYRLTAFGWLWSEETQALGDTNMGLRDQRLVLQWIQENIAAFGGDPRRVTIYGESAGGISIGKHLMAYGGRDDGLFHNAILESGGPLEKWPYGFTNATEYMLTVYNNLTDATCCSNATSPLECLRYLPFSALNAALNITNTWIAGTGLGPFIATLNNDILLQPATTQISTGAFLKVPILYGTNTDEGTAIAPAGINTDGDFAREISKGGPDVPTIETLQLLYPDINAIGIPATYNPLPKTPSSYGAQWKRAAAYWGDIVEHAPRRAVTTAWAKHNTTAYSYRFNVQPVGNADAIGATHFAEVAWVFDNVDGVGYEINPFGDVQRYRELAGLMGRMWVSFVWFSDPYWHGLSDIPTWPKYEVAGAGVGSNFVFEGNRSSCVEVDDFRAAQIQYLIDVMPGQFHY
ncbi:hypothetical protein M409DRAFT_66181 [Zasmidium cellare ATCC 36951]|uniref:Carboxylic ester hydrolase n=1 Tax=Zasmidium cellare ATCC 36951 TaxID=1080233 RepID=A0A6A6CLU3_ZASCE|nr:uncharacterized protein M409DRAFT_66181 [Zasmidium cellare ATCC 36951]KAF2167120.1 hypothetical protein M409DRAFT_66181 [Zasmidium cellare ATCC 36951]